MTRSVDLTHVRALLGVSRALRAEARIEFLARRRAAYLYLYAAADEARHAARVALTAAKRRADA